ncbi:MAG: AAA family ATPase [Proteobacteria bacterium]|nr:AAA family ATPase [Pseudomonadota bacterium]
MRVESICVKNFKAFRNVEFKEIPLFCVLVGANGSGKSTLFDVFGFLKDCLVYNVKSAVQNRGGMKELASRGGENLVIEITVQFRMTIAGVDRLVTYHLEVDEKDGKPAIRREILRYKRGRYGSPFHFLDFQHGQGYAISNEEDFNKPDEELTREETTLDGPHILAIKGLGQFSRFKAASTFRQLIENWHMSDFHIDSARGSKLAAGYDEHLSPRGDNLQLVARNLYDNHRNVFLKIIEAMKRRVPGIEDVEPVPTMDGRLVLAFRDHPFATAFVDRYVSDGTIKMFAYLVLLHDPAPHPLLCVEEPENQLYPSLLYELVEEFRQYAQLGGQVFVSTHSPDFLNGVQLGEVFWLAKKEGYTQAYRAQENEQVRTYMEDGDQMGFLWKQGFFEGADPK